MQMAQDADHVNVSILYHNPRVGHPGQLHVREGFGDALAVAGDEADPLVCNLRLLEVERNDVAVDPKGLHQVGQPKGAGAAAGPKLDHRPRLCLP